MKTYRYNLNNFVRGQVLAKNKRAVKKVCQRMAEIYFPLRGIETLEIERVKEPTRAAEIRVRD